MRALVLCAGLGTRLRPLTDSTPKPLISVAGRTLLERHLAGLADAGFRDVVVNTAHLADQVEAYAGDGRRWGLRLRISREGTAPLETGGAMRHALPLLGPAPFAVINGDIVCDYPLARLREQSPSACHLVLIDNPAHNADGDFDVRDGRLDNTPRLTYSGIGVFHPRLVAAVAEAKFSVVPLVRAAAERGEASAEHYQGRWFDIGTPERLAQARDSLQN